MKRHIGEQVVTARVQLPKTVQLATKVCPNISYWVLKNSAKNFLSSPIHQLSPEFALRQEGTHCILTADARNVVKLRRIVHRLCNLAETVHEGGLIQKFAIFYDHFPVRYTLDLKDTVCHVKLENFLGYKSPLVLKIHNVLEARPVDDTHFEMRFTDRDARGTSLKLFFDIKLRLRSKLSKLKFLDCIYPVDEA